jgi:hypothetical protein
MELDQGRDDLGIDEGGDHEVVDGTVMAALIPVLLRGADQTIAMNGDPGLRGEDLAAGRGLPLNEGIKTLEGGVGCAQGRIRRSNGIEGGLGQKRVVSRAGVSG